MRRRQAAMLAAVVAAGLGAAMWLRAEVPELGKTPAAESQPAPSAMTTRVYDIRDLLVYVPHFTHMNTLLPVTEINESVYTKQPNASLFADQPLPGGSSGGGASSALADTDESRGDQARQPGPGVSACPPLFTGSGSGVNRDCTDPDEPWRGQTRPLTPAMMRSQLRQIMMVVDPPSWKSKAPDTGEAPDPVFLQDRMVIRQTPGNHAKIETLLTDIRDGYQRQLVIQGWWVQADEKDLAGLMAANKEADPRQVNADALKAAKVLYRGRIVCYDGQRTFVSSGRGYSAVLALNAVVSENTSEITPDVRIVHAGMALETETQLSADGKTAHLYLWGTVGRRRGPVAPVERKTLTHIDADVQRFQTALIVPLGVPILTSGGSFGDDAKGMYLVVQVDRVGK